jgi:hypothetical protein
MINDEKLESDIEMLRMGCCVTSYNNDNDTDGTDNYLRVLEEEAFFEFNVRQKFKMNSGLISWPQFLFVSNILREGRARTFGRELEFHAQCECDDYGFDHNFTSTEIDERLAWKMLEIDERLAFIQLVRKEGSSNLSVHVLENNRIGRHFLMEH